MRLGTTNGLSKILFTMLVLFRQAASPYQITKSLSHHICQDAGISIQQHKCQSKFYVQHLPHMVGLAHWAKVD